MVTCRVISNLTAPFTPQPEERYERNEEGKTFMNQYNQVPHLTQDTKCESDKNTRQHHTQESQEISSFPAGDHNAKRNSQGNSTKKNTKHKKQNKIHKRGAVLELSVRKLLEKLNNVDGSNLTLMFDVDQNR